MLTLKIKPEDVTLQQLIVLANRTLDTRLRVIELRKKYMAEKDWDKVKQLGKLTKSLTEDFDHLYIVRNQKLNKQEVTV